MNKHPLSTYTCIYAHYNHEQKVRRYVITFLRSLAEFNCRIIFVSNSAIDSESEKTLINSISGIQLFQRENKGFDWGAWKWALENISLPENTTHVLLANDSLIGPITDLGPIMQQMHNKNADFWSMTEVADEHLHLHSCFMVLSEKILNAPSFRQFLHQNFNSFSEADRIDHGERLLSKMLSDSGFSGSAYMPYQPLGAPFIKKNLILYNPDNIESAGINIFTFLQKYPQYDIENITDLIESACRPGSSVSSQVKISVVCHLYYPHTIFPFLIKLSKLKAWNAQFIINLSSSLYLNDIFCRLLQKIFPGAVLMHTPAVGRDIGGKMATIDVLLKNNIQSDYTLIIHDKLSPHTPLGSNWRNQLLEVIGEQNIPKVIEKFQKSETTGIITAGDYIKNEYDPDTKEFRCSSSANLLEIIKKYKLNITNYNYAAGTIFWIRTSILKRFFGSNPPLEIRQTLEKGNVLDFSNGTNVHAWERTFSFITNDQGYKTSGL